MVVVRVIMPAHERVDRTPSHESVQVDREAERGEMMPGAQVPRSLVRVFRAESLEAIEKRVEQVDERQPALQLEIALLLLTQVRELAVAIDSDPGRVRASSLVTLIRAEKIVDPSREIKPREIPLRDVRAVV